MFGLKPLIVVMALLVMIVPFRMLQAQDTTPEPDLNEAISAWEAAEARAWAWASCSLHMEDRVAEYEADLAAGLTKAETLAAWCLEKRAEADTESATAWNQMRAQVGADENMGAGDPTLALKCACVCAMSSEANCTQCLENPSDPALLELPGVCPCIVAH